MATFQGSIQEFHHFIGPKIRNAINNWTRKHRNEKNGICEFCGEDAELQSAHVHGRDRRTIIESVLNHHINHEGNVLCALEEVESAIIKAHEPIEETFKFICHSCHVEYDSLPKEKTQRKDITEPSFDKIQRIKLWAGRPEQINHKIIRAYLELEKKGDVTLCDLKKHCGEKMKVSTFDSNFASMKTDHGNSHGAVFYEDSPCVRVWDRARAEIEKHFHSI